MLSRSILVLAKPRQASSFAVFYGKIARSLTYTKMPLRMKVAGALWTLTAPKAKVLTKTQLVHHALALYKKHGDSVLERARVLKAKRMKVVKSAKVSAKPKAKLQKPVSVKKPVAKSISRSQNRSAISRKPRKLPPSTRQSLGAHGKHLGTAAGDNTPAKRMSYDAFRRSMVKRGNLKLSKSLNEQIHRLWRLIPTQTHLSNKAREYMALRLIKKHLQGSKKGQWQNKNQTKMLAKNKAIQGKAESSGKKALKVSGALKKDTNVLKFKSNIAEGKKRSHHPFLKFYRAMVLTGRIPNHPKGVRSRLIKELWNYTKHLKALSSKIKLGVAYATGAQEVPKLSQASKAKNAKALSKSVQVASSAKHQVKKASKVLSLRVPPNYRADPFLATYRVLMSHIPNKTPDARMKTISRAWMQTVTPNEKDKRTPKQRIQAVAKALALL